MICHDIITVLQHSIYIYRRGSTQNMEYFKYAKYGIYIYNSVVS